MAYAQAAVAIAALTSQIVQGNRQAAAQRAAGRDQQRAQDRALSEAVRTDALNAQDQARASQRTPDAAALLGDAQANPNGSPTMLSGPLGVVKPKLRLGQRGLLGE